MRLDKMREPIIRQEPGIERRTFGPRRASTKVEQRLAVGCFDNQRAEFGARPYTLEAVEIRARVSRSRQARDEPRDRGNVARRADAIRGQLARG